MDGTLEWVVVIVAAVLVVAMAAVMVLTTVRSRKLRERFGPEYERVMEEAGGDRRRAESELRDRLARRDAVALRPLSPAARARYERRWNETKARFVDSPTVAVEDAQALVDELTTERGYPDGDKGTDRIDLVSVDHPEAAEHYRAAHQLRNKTGASADTATATEERRQTLVHYGALVASLLDSGAEQAIRHEREPTSENVTEPDPKLTEERVT